MSAEKYQLESSMTQSTKQMERMSMNVEELQWRIRNNYELPVDIYSKPAPEMVMGQQNVDKKPDTNVPCSQNIDGHGQVGSGIIIIRLKYPSNWSVINVQPTQMCRITLVLDLPSSLELSSES